MPAKRSIDKGVRAHRARILAASTHYEVLAVPPAATEETIRAAHRGLARIFHPDRCWLEDAHDLMASVNGAYAVLSDKAARRRYDTVTKTAAQTCERCEGAGHYFKQQGFKKRVQTTCPACDGSGKATS